LTISDSFVQDAVGNCHLFLKVIPRSSRNQVVGVENGKLKVKIQAPPVEGTANEAVLELLAEWLDWPRGSLFLLRGERSRHKVVQVTGLKVVEARAKLKTLLLKGEKHG
jgi:uncharacterized protein (TIGR00251 family)